MSDTEKDTFLEEEIYRKDVSIQYSNQKELEQLIKDHPEIRLKYEHLVVSSQQIVNDTIEELNFLKATLDVAIRKDPKKFGLDKITESAVSNYILTHKEIREKQIELSNHQISLSFYRGVLSALDRKEKSLDNLVELSKR